MPSSDLPPVWWHPERIVNAWAEFVTAIVHETSERPNEFVFYELWKGTRAEFDAIQGPKPYRKACMENVKQFLERVDVEWNSPILEWGTNLTGRNQSA